MDMSQPQAYIYPLSLQPPTHLPSYVPSKFSQSTGFGLPATYSKFPLAMSILHMVMYMFQYCSLKSSFLLPPPLCPKVCPFWVYLSWLLLLGRKTPRFSRKTLQDCKTFTYWWRAFRVCRVASVMSNSDLTDHSLPGSSVHGILQARILEWIFL